MRARRGPLRSRTRLPHTVFIPGAQLMFSPARPRRLAVLLAASLTWCALPPHLDAQTPSGAAQDSSKRKKRDLPLEPARKIQFTTSKGSWISVDVSPDGQTLVFDLVGDLYTMPIA